MELRKQQTTDIGTLEAQVEERKDQNLAHPSYRSPEMFLVGKAKRLVAAAQNGIIYDLYGQWKVPS